MRLLPSQNLLFLQSTLLAIKIMGQKKLDIQFSTRTTSLAKFKVTFPMVLFAQLVADGYSPSEVCWAIKFGFSPQADFPTVEATAKRIMGMESVKKLVDYFKEELGKKRIKKENKALTQLISQEIVEKGEMSKEATAMEILRSAQAMPEGSKERIDGFIKYADIMGYKKTDEKDVSIRHQQSYAPATCDKCPLLKWIKENHPDALARKEMKPKSEV